MTEESVTTRECIFQAALELFTEKGYYETSMAAVANRAGVGKGTLYWYFSSKEEMFKVVLTEKAEVLFQEIEKVFQRLTDGILAPDQALWEFINVKMTFMAKNLELSQILFNNIQYTDDDFKDRLIQKHQRVICIAREIINQGIEKGLFRQGSAKDMAVAIIGMTNSFGTLMFFENILDINGIVDFIYKMVLDGIRNDG